MSAGESMRPEDAAAALQSVATGRERSAALRRYSGMASTVVVWGLIWLACNLLSQFFPWGIHSWLAGVPIGIIWSMLNPLPRPAGTRRRTDFRIPLSIFSAFGFLWLMMILTNAVILGPRGGDALISLFVAAAYVIVGIWAGLRLALLGVALTIAICLGWFVFPEWLYLWLGIGGGGALIAGGPWLRSA